MACTANLCTNVSATQAVCGQRTYCRQSNNSICYYCQEELPNCLEFRQFPLDVFNISTYCMPDMNLLTSDSNTDLNVGFPENFTCIENDTFTPPNCPTTLPGVPYTMLDNGN